MIIRVILASIVASIVLYAWGFLFWGVLPLGSAAMEEEPFGGEAMVGTMEKVLPTTGVYFLPYPVNPRVSSEAEQENFERRHRQGPLVRVFYREAGAEPMAPSVFVKGFLHNLGIALLMGIVLACAAPALPRYLQRVGLLFLVGAVAAVWLGLNEAIWFHHPWKFELYQAGYVLVGGLLMALIMAAVIRVKPAAPRVDSVH